MNTTATIPTSLSSATLSQSKQQASYFAPWTYNKPLLVSARRNAELKSIQVILWKLIHHFVTHYDRFESMMPITEEQKRVLQHFKGRPYTPGSYRTDFVIDQMGQFKLIEITCRFAFNGLFLSSFIDQQATKYAQLHLPNLKTRQYVSHLFSHIGQRLKNKKITILSHLGKQEESRFYQPIFEQAGFSIQKVFADEIEKKIKIGGNQAFITELNQEDYYQLSDRVLNILATATTINDLRTVFLIHDKRFFSVMGNEDFRQDILTPAEIELFDKYYIPTYKYGERIDQWAIAKQNKADWIVKHKHLGKSAKVFAGAITKESIWTELFDSKQVEQMILQPFINQKKFNGCIGKEQFNDFVVGTLLFFDRQYFGPGIFRASSHPITNIVDDRKVMHLNLTNDDNLEGYYQL